MAVLLPFMGSLVCGGVAAFSGYQANKTIQAKEATLKDLQTKMVEALPVIYDDQEKMDFKNWDGKDVIARVQQPPNQAQKNGLLGVYEQNIDLETTVTHDLQPTLDFDSVRATEIGAASYAAYANPT